MAFSQRYGDSQAASSRTVGRWWTQLDDLLRIGLLDNNDGGTQGFRGSSGESDRRMMESFRRRLIVEYQKNLIES
jgi:hypothetical protein